MAKSVEAAHKALRSIQGVTIRLRPEGDTCPACGERLKVYKTRSRSVVTLGYGRFEAQEVLLRCARPCGVARLNGDRAARIHRPPFLAKVVAPRQLYGFDVLARVGRLRFLECRQRREIQEELRRSHGLSIPESSIQQLVARFVDAVRAVHEDRAERLRRGLEASGGYVLHVDGTCEEGSQIHFACLTGCEEPLVLWSEKIDSENATEIRLVLREVGKRFGRPAATVQDLSAPIRKAVLEEWPGMAVFYCHWHFLSDVGKDLLEEPYKRLRLLLRQSEIRPRLRRFLKRVHKELGEKRDEARRICQHLEDCDRLRPEGRSLKASAVAGALAEWILAAPAGGSGRGFPFDLSHLALDRRVRRAAQVLDQQILPHLGGRLPRGERLLYRLRGILYCFVRSTALHRAARRVQEPNDFFTRLREALRLAAEGSREGMSEPSTFATEKEAREAETAVRRLREELQLERHADPSPKRKRCIEIVLTHLEKYWEGLFGHRIEVSHPEPRTVRVPRTNNRAERFFRCIKRLERRITGKKKLHREVDSLPAHALLVFNLNNPQYVKLVCGTLEGLPDAFAELAEKGKLAPGEKKAPPTILHREIRRMADFPASLPAVFAGP